MNIRTPASLGMIALMSFTLAGCDDGTTTPVASTPTPAQQACLRDVGRTTGAAEIVLLGSEFSQAGTLVTVGVGPNRAPWQCIAYDDGTTAGIESMVDEGI